MKFLNKGRRQLNKDLQATWQFIVMNDWTRNLSYSMFYEEDGTMNMVEHPVSYKHRLERKRIGF